MKLRFCSTIRKARPGEKSDRHGTDHRAGQSGAAADRGPDDELRRQQKSDRLRGDDPLMGGDKKVMPAYVDKPVMAENSGFKGKLTYAATIIIDFPTDELNGDEAITLVVDPPDGLGPAGSRNANFNVPFDLASVK